MITREPPIVQTTSASAAVSTTSAVRAHSRSTSSIPCSASCGPTQSGVGGRSLATIATLSCGIRLRLPDPRSAISGDSSANRRVTSTPSQQSAAST